MIGKITIAILIIIFLCWSLKKPVAKFLDKRDKRLLAKNEDVRTFWMYLKAKREISNQADILAQQALKEDNDITVAVYSDIFKKLKKTKEDLSVTSMRVSVLKKYDMIKEIANSPDFISFNYESIDNEDTTTHIFRRK